MHNAVTKNEMRAWEDFIDPLFKFCLHLKLCQIMIVAIMCVFKCFVREVNWMPIQNNARGIGNLEILDKCNFLKFLSNKIFLRLVEDLWLWFGGLKVGGRGGGGFGWSPRAGESLRVETPDQRNQSHDCHSRSTPKISGYFPNFGKLNFPALSVFKAEKFECSDRRQWRAAG